MPTESDTGSWEVVFYESAKIWEVRTEQANVQRRLLYFAAPERKFVMLHGFVKKTDKTPSKEITVAEQRMQDYVARLGRE